MTTPKNVYAKSCSRVAKIELRLSFCAIFVNSKLFQSKVCSTVVDSQLCVWVKFRPKICTRYYVITF